MSFRDSVNNLVSRSTAAKMGLVKHIEEFMSAIGEHGLLKTEPVRTQPYAVHTVSRIPIPLMQKVKEELCRMDENYIVEKVTQSTDWCAPMVP
jgi:hypothetical protein